MARAGSLVFAIRVKPGAKRTRVGGQYPGPKGPALIVAVSAPAVEGKANDAVSSALAEAFAVRKRDIEVVSGARSRDKIVQVNAPEGREPARLTARLEHLLADSGSG